MDEKETRAFIKILHSMNVMATLTRCAICLEYGFYVLGMMKRPPMTCGRWICGSKAGEAWARGYVKG